MLEILQLGFSSMWTKNFRYEAGFWRDRETRDQTANIGWITQKAREFQKKIYFCFIEYAKTFVLITANCRKFLKRLEYKMSLLASWETCMQAKKQRLELDMQQLTGSKSEKEYNKALVTMLI